MTATDADQGEDKSFPVVDADFTTASGTKKSAAVGCVEIAVKPEGVAVRDSKNRAKGILFFNHSEWAYFKQGVIDGEFDLK